MSSRSFATRDRRANGMPELHKLTPILGVLRDKGYHVAL
jgi:phosphogluconate dehydratase